MLNYINKLRGQCPEGQELQFFKIGGKVCKKCAKKVTMEDGSKTLTNVVDAFKCGRKMKKKKCENGGLIDFDKCGAKMKKKKYDFGGNLPLDKCGNKLKKKCK